MAFDGETGGLGWLPDGRLLFISRLDRAVMRREPDGTLVPHGDLRPWATWHANDMVVATNGQAYAGNFGFDLDGLYERDGRRERRSSPPRSSGSTPTAPAARRPTDLRFPNGTVITEDGATLIIAESMGGRLTAFDRERGRHPDQPPRVGRRSRRGARRHLPVRRQHDLGRQRARRPSASASPRAARCSNG